MHAWRNGGRTAWLLAIALLVGLAPVAAAQDTTVRGKAGYQAVYGYTAGEAVEQALTLRVSLDSRLDFGKLHVDGDAVLPFSGQPLGLQFGQAYVDIYGNSTDWRIGRQIVSWGTADGINPTNVINPQGALSPASLALAGEAPKGTPVLAVQGTYYGASGWGFTGVGVAEFVPAETARQILQAIAARIGGQMGGGPLPIDGPAPVPADGSQIEWAARAEGMIGGHNVYFTYFRGWDDYPAAWIEFTTMPGPDPTPVPERLAAAYRKVQKLGVATAGTVGPAGLWTELSYTVPEQLPVLDGPGALSSNGPSVEAVVGADFTFAGGVMVSGQLVYNGGGSLLNPYKEPGAGPSPQTYLVAVVRYSPEVGHDLQGTALINAKDGGVLAMGRYTYDINQATRLILGAAHVIAGPGSEFREIKPSADLITAGIEFSF